MLFLFNSFYTSSKLFSIRCEIGYLVADILFKLNILEREIYFLSEYFRSDICIGSANSMAFYYL